MLGASKGAREKQLGLFGPCRITHPFSPKKRDKVGEGKGWGGDNSLLQNKSSFPWPLRDICWQSLCFIKAIEEANIKLWVLMFKHRYLSFQPLLLPLLLPPILPFPNVPWKCVDSKRHLLQKPAHSIYTWTACRPSCAHHGRS